MGEDDGVLQKRKHCVKGRETKGKAGRKKEQRKKGQSEK